MHRRSFKEFSRRLLRRLASEERGIALVLALGMTVALGATVTTVVTYTASNQRDASRSNADQVAFALAEAALNNAYATLYGATNPRDGNAVPPASQLYAGGTAKWWGTLEGEVWKFVGEGRVPNPTGPGGADVVRRVSGRARLGSATRGGANNAVWNYVYSDATSGCMNLGNSVNINVPLYARGNVCLAQSAMVTGYALQVGGYVQTQNQASVGNPDLPAGHPDQIKEVHIGGGCRYGNNGAFVSPCTTAQRVWSTNPPDANPVPLHKPPVDVASWYLNAKPGPKQNCTEGTFPPGFDNDGVLNASLGNVDIAPNYPYDCKVKDPATGELIGRIAWTGGTSGTLTIHGTIFIDGNITFSQQTNAVYSGRATIYSGGTVSVSQYTKLCGVADCTTAWKPLENLLAFVAGGCSANNTSIDIQNHAYFQGASYAVCDFREGQNTTVWGPIIANQLYIANSTSNFYVPIGTLLPGMPAEYEQVVTITNEAGSWSG